MHLLCQLQAGRVHVKQELYNHIDVIVRKDFLKQLI